MILLRYFTEHAGRELHPCIIAEILLKWNSVKESVCPDNIKNLFSKVQEMPCRNFINHTSIELMVSSRRLGCPVEKPFFYFVKFKRAKTELIRCIQAGDSTPLVVPVKGAITNCSNNKQRVPEFRYNSAVVSTYGINNGHWYVHCVNILMVNILIGKFYFLSRTASRIY